MATLKEDSDAWAASGIIRRDFKNDKSGGYEETPHRKKKPKNRGKKREGCPANNNGSHVYVWVLQRYAEYGRDRLRDWGYMDPKLRGSYDSFYHWLMDYEVKICCGCYKRYGWRRKVMKT